MALSKKSPYWRAPIDGGDASPSRASSPPSACVWLPTMIAAAIAVSSRIRTASFSVTFDAEALSDRGYEGHPCTSACVTGSAAVWSGRGGPSLRERLLERRPVLRILDLARRGPRRAAAASAIEKGASGATRRTASST